MGLKESAATEFRGIVAASELATDYEKIQWIDTGNLGLNKAINYQGKGIPTGTTVESFGDSQSGKTVIGMH